MPIYTSENKTHGISLYNCFFKIRYQLPMDVLWVSVRMQTDYCLIQINRFTYKLEYQVTVTTGFLLVVSYKIKQCL